MDISNTDLNSDLNMDLPNINPLPDDGIPAQSMDNTSMSQPNPDMSQPIPDQNVQTQDMSQQNTAPTMSDPSMDNQIPTDPDMSAPEEEETINEESENTIKEGTELYYVNETLNYEFETTKLSDDKVGTWLFLTTKSAEKMSLEDWEDKFLYKYIVQDSFEIPEEQRKSTEPCLYKELIINPEEDKQIFVLEDDLQKLKVQDHYLLKHDYLASTLSIPQRRFACLDQGEIVCSADKQVIKNPKPENNEAGCFFYITTILPEESVLQDWEDKTLNVYYFTEPMVLPYGADNNPDQFFDNIYIDKVDNGDGTETRIFSYYDDTVMGEYLKNEPKTAEVFLVESDLSKLSH